MSTSGGATDGGMDGGMDGGGGSGRFASMRVPIDMTESLAIPEPRQIQTGATFVDHAWSSSLRAQLIVAEFARSDWQSFKLKDPQTDAPSLRVEIMDLIEQMETKRAERAAEIVAQDKNLTPYFSDLLMANAGSRPATWALVHIGLAVGHLVGMYFKDQKKRARPVQVYPGLMPMILTPPHPSYPSGHSTQAHLIALCVSKAVPHLEATLHSLADRIAINREIAGLHFRSDSIAGRELATSAFTYLADGKLFSGVVATAKKEWVNVTAVDL